MLREISAELCSRRNDILICDRYFLYDRWLLHFQFFYKGFLIRNLKLRILRVDFMHLFGNLNNHFGYFNRLNFIRSYFYRFRRNNFLNYLLIRYLNFDLLRHLFFSWTLLLFLRVNLFSLFPLSLLLLNGYLLVSILAHTKLQSPSLLIIHLGARCASVQCKE